ncbi:hypothetical protein M6G65_07000 [Methylobacterium tardum]|uniref:hypothetical protein n=1 Tax=Methylobacterium tardum TaxID=374432 RepID=UPI0020226094|nr:hypothetical protein [Methylobacterium tardum]URD38201.1 hypothetical protein M6G65_07000 [Methylobacterium tardum]
MSLVWDGITKSGTLPEASAAIRHRLADAAERYDWTETLSLLADHADLVNTTRPDGSALLLRFITPPTVTPLGRSVPHSSRPGLGGC